MNPLAIPCVVFMFIIILMYRYWPRRVFIVKAYVRYKNQVRIIRVCSSEKEAKDFIDTRIRYFIMNMSKKDLIDLCGQLGIGGMSERQYKFTMRDLILKEMKYPEKYEILLKRFHFHYSDKWPIFP